MSGPVGLPCWSLWCKCTKAAPRDLQRLRQRGLSWRCCACPTPQRCWLGQRPAHGWAGGAQATIGGGRTAQCSAAALQRDDQPRFSGAARAPAERVAALRLHADLLARARRNAQRRNSHTRRSRCAVWQRELAGGVYVCVSRGERVEARAEGRRGAMQRVLRHGFSTVLAHVRNANNSVVLHAELPKLFCASLPSAAVRRYRCRALDPPFDCHHGPGHLLQRCTAG